MQANNIANHKWFEKTKHPQKEEILWILVSFYSKENMLTEIALTQAFLLNYYYFLIKSPVGCWTVLWSSSHTPRYCQWVLQQVGLFVTVMHKYNSGLATCRECRITSSCNRKADAGSLSLQVLTMWYKLISYFPLWECVCVFAGAQVFILGL